MDHLIAGNQRFAALLSDHPEAQPAGPESGDDRATAYRSSAAALGAAFSAPGALDLTYQSPVGPAPGLALVELRIAEHSCTAGTWPGRPGNTRTSPKTWPDRRSPAPS